MSSFPTITEAVVLAFVATSVLSADMQENSVMHKNEFNVRLCLRTKMDYSLL